MIEKVNPSHPDKLADRIAGDVDADICIVPQDTILASNQKGTMRCGDNGIFKGMPITQEQKELSGIARSIYQEYPTDGKYILDGKRLIICQSCAPSDKLRRMYQ